MSNLSNLHISGSYKGLINLADSTQPLVSQSGDINLQDGLGDNVGVKINAQTKKVTIDNDLRVDGNTDLNGDVDISGSLTFQGNLDVQGNVTGYTASFDTINTRLLHVTEESSSVILSSGSNVLGDEDSDTQTFNGSVYIPYREYLRGNATDTDTRINNKLETSWTSSVFLPFSTSVDTRLVALEDFSSSLVADFVTDTELSSALESVTSSLQSQIDTKLDSSWTSSVFTPFSSSVDSRIDSKLDTSTFTSFSSSVSSEQITQDNKLNSLISATGSYARLDIDNNFSGSQIITGSVNGNVESLTVTSQTASIDCSQGNFFTLELPSGATHFEATNIVPGQTISLRLGANSGRTVTFDSSIELPVGLTYSPSISSSYDLLTFVSFDTTTLYGVAVNLFNR